MKPVNTVNKWALKPIHCSVSLKSMKMTILHQYHYLLHSALGNETTKIFVDLSWIFMVSKAAIKVNNKSEVSLKRLFTVFLFRVQKKFTVCIPHYKVSYFCFHMGL